MEIFNKPINQSRNSSTTKIGDHIPLWIFSVNYMTFDNIENRHSL